MDIQVEVRNNIGWITLNRPDKLNALSYEMINSLYEQLVKWKHDDQVLLVCMEGAGNRAFSAGGDVHHLYKMRNDDIQSHALGFFHTEYCMNMLMHMYPKPIVTYMNGIVMGGGVGVAVAGSHRIINETTKWAMPEMNIGLYPDVGGSYFLNQSPGQVGRYLALTSKTIKPFDVLHINAADYYIKSDNWTSLKQVLNETNWLDIDVNENLNKTIAMHEAIIDGSSELEIEEERINSYFRHNTIEEIIESLEQSTEDKLWTKKIVDTLLSKSPTSLKVTLEQLIRGEALDIKQCLIMELNMSMNFMKNHDFFEGVRSVLVDKDRNPKWQPSLIDQVTQEDVNKYFSYEWRDENPLIKFDPKSI